MCRPRKQVRSRRLVERFSSWCDERCAFCAGVAQDVKAVPAAEGAGLGLSADPAAGVSVAVVVAGGAGGDAGAGGGAAAESSPGLARTATAELRHRKNQLSEQYSKRVVEREALKAKAQSILNKRYHDKADIYEVVSPALLCLPFPAHSLAR